MIKFTCARCGKHLSIADENAGRRGRCPRCKSICIVPIPQLEPDPPPARKPESIPLAKSETRAKSAPKPRPYTGPRFKHFFTKVVGVTHENRDGSSRQDIIRQCSIALPGRKFLEQLDLDHEDENPYDPNAVAVKRETGEQLGYLSAELAEEVVQRNGRGVKYGCYIAAVTGGGDRYYGANLLMVMYAPDVSQEEAQEYVGGIKLKQGTQSDDPDDPQGMSFAETLKLFCRRLFGRKNIR